MDEQPRLTAQEARVAALVAEGWRNHVIAERLGSTVPAVETTVTRIYAKYGLDVAPEIDKRVVLARLTTEVLAEGGGPGDSGE